MKPLSELLDGIQRRRASANPQLPAAVQPEAAPARPAGLIQLPLWPEPVRAVPNAVLRSALFGAVRRGRRRYINGEDLAAVDGLTVRYKGERLDQGDLDVWESVLHAVRQQELGSRCRVTSYSLLMLLGLTDTGKNRATLHERIERLVANAVTIRQGPRSYIGGLVAWAAKDDTTREWVIELDPRIAALFEADAFTQVEWAVRHDLAGHQLAQWLHGFYSSHADPFPLKVETLHRLCGSETGRMDHFKEKLRKALDAVSEASAAQGQAFGWAIRGDLVHVTKTASGSQRRHLAKRPRKSRTPRA